LTNREAPKSGLELASQGTQVSALHVGYIDTDMARHVEADKNDPATVAQLALDGIEAGQCDPDGARRSLTRLIGERRIRRG
jgi:NAD(P)-dependent dehydrogenase (short-subunit alcohol dehydrogenase family)